jgi:predicted dehydrogenase
VIKLGIISAATYAASFRGDDVPRTPGSFHGTAFSTTYNGFDAAKAKQWDWTFASASRQIDGARIVKIWDPQRQWAQRLAQVCDIDEVCDSPEACCQDVDGVIIVDDGSGSHSDYAEYPLRQGIPTFCDKPLAMTAQRARQIADLVKSTGTPFMSASSLRFVPDIIALKDELSNLGEVHLATAACGNDLIYYGIHAASMYYGLFGGGAVSCLNVGKPDRNLVRVRFEHGCDLMLIVGEPPYMSSGFQVNLYAQKGWRTVTPDLTDLYYYLQERFIDMLRSGEPCVPVDEEVEIIAVLEAGKRSLAEDREVSIAEVMASTG